MYDADPTVAVGRFDGRPFYWAAGETARTATPVP
jgi:hypothetical protein